MLSSNILKDILVFLLVYIPPLIIYIKFWRDKDRKSLGIILISVFYIGASIYTQNLLPFILVIINLYFMRLDHEYDEYKLSLKGFKILKGLRYSFASYFITIIISMLTLSIFSALGIDIREQEIVSWMADMPLIKFMIMVPVAVIFAPVLEEFVFRWFFFERLFKNRIGVYAAAALSSMIFASIHFSLQAFPMIFWIGLFNCYLMDKKGYWYAVLNHSLFNSVTVLFLFMQKINLSI